MFVVPAALVGLDDAAVGGLAEVAGPSVRGYVERGDLIGVVGDQLAHPPSPSPESPPSAADQQGYAAERRETYGRGFGRRDDDDLSRGGVRDHESRGYVAERAI